MDKASLSPILDPMNIYQSLICVLMRKKKNIYIHLFLAILLRLLLHCHEQLTLQFAVIFGDLIQHASQFPIILVQSVQLPPKCNQLEIHVPISFNKFIIKTKPKQKKRWPIYIVKYNYRLMDSMKKGQKLTTYYLRIGFFFIS